MEFKKEIYKGFEITYFIEDNGKFYATAMGMICSFHPTEKPKDRYKWEYFKDAERLAKNFIDDFLKRTPKSYDELADAITDTLVWDGYEDCHVDTQILQSLVENFIKFNKNKK